MKFFILMSLKMYQALLSPAFHLLFGTSVGCRYNPSCSEFLKLEIQKKGLKEGLLSGMKRFLTCHPWSQVNG